MIPSSAPVHAPAGRRLGRELYEVERLLQDHLASAVDRYGAAALDVIDLPPVAGPTGELVPAQIRAAGALLWASEIEQAGLPAFVDALAEGAVEGKVLLPITSGADRLMLYRRTRNERFTGDERRALYERLFGAPGDGAHPFAASFHRLLQTLDAIAHAGPQESLVGPAARANASAREVAQWLSEHSGGIAPFAARSIAEHIRDALAVLHDPDVARALGGGSVWQMLRLHAAEVLGRAVDPGPHLERASAALALVSWMARAASAIEGGTATVPPPQVLQAAVLWLSSGRGQA